VWFAITGFQNADKRSIALPTLQTVGVASLFMIFSEQTAREYQFSTMAFIFSPHPNIRDYIGVKSSPTIITDK
jgi:hypothetical protein